MSISDVVTAADVSRQIVPTRVAHFVIRSSNVAPLVKWYKTVFHADAVFDNGDLAFLYFDDEHHRIAIAGIPDLEEQNDKVPGIDHIAFTYRNIGDLLVTYKRLKAGGIEPFVKIDHGPTTSFYYSDPDNNRIELQVDNFKTREEAHDYFRSEDFAKNPLGVMIDADDLLARYERGEEEAGLLSAGTRSEALAGS